MSFEVWVVFWNGGEDHRPTKIGLRRGVSTSTLHHCLDSYAPSHPVRPTMAVGRRSSPPVQNRPHKFSPAFLASTFMRLRVQSAARGGFGAFLYRHHPATTFSWPDRPGFPCCFLLSNPLPISSLCAWQNGGRSCLPPRYLRRPGIFAPRTRIGSPTRW